MQEKKLWLYGIFLGAALVGAAMLPGTTPTTQAQPGPVVERGDHWRYHDGHWSYWHEGDRRWYYTDGSHWYSNHGNGGWQLYRFDKKFGREGFVRGPYQYPEGTTIVVPRHDVYRVR